VKILLVEHIHQPAKICGRKGTARLSERKNVAGILASIGNCDAAGRAKHQITRQIIEAAPRLAALGDTAWATIH